MDLSGGQQPLAYSIADLCRLTGVSRTVIYQCIASGALVVHKLGRRTIIMAPHALAFLANLPLGRRS